MAPSTDLEKLARLAGYSAALRQAVALEAHGTTRFDSPPPCCHRGCAGCTRSKEAKE
jgi:hypothetical protein